VDLESVGRSGRTRTSRLRSWLPILVPVAVLALVVGGAVLGQGDPAQPIEEVAAAVATPRETADATHAIETPPATRPPGAVPQTGAPLPGRILGLAVEDVVDARDSPRRARPDQLVAIRGWLTVAPTERRCELAWHLACRTEATLTATSSPSGASIRLETQPGVPLRGLQRQDPRAGTWSVPNQAIVIGRFTQPLYRECGLPVPECQPLLTIERLAWIRRSARERPVAYGPGATGAGLEVGEAERAARDALGAGGVDVGDTLLLALFDRATLGLVDPLAAAASRGDPGARLWYLRALVWRGPNAVVAWVVVDDTDRRIVATGV
jgi:hypothetical protein